MLFNTYLTADLVAFFSFFPNFLATGIVSVSNESENAVQCDAIVAKQNIF